MTDPDGYTTDYTYGPAGTLASVAYPDGYTAQYECEQTAALLATTGAPPPAVTSVHATYTQELTPQLSATTTTVLDRFGLPVSVTDGAGQHDELRAERQRPGDRDGPAQSGFRAVRRP